MRGEDSETGRECIEKGSMEMGGDEGAKGQEALSLVFNEGISDRFVRGSDSGHFVQGDASRFRIDNEYVWI